MTNDAKRALIKAMKRPPKPAPTLDPMQEMFLRSLEDKGIIDKTLPEPEEDEGERRRRAMQDLAEWNRYLASGDYERDRQEREEAEAEAERYESLTLAEKFNQAFRTTGAAVPLNGAGVLMAAIRGLGAKNVTSNGQSATGTL